MSSKSKQLLAEVQEAVRAGQGDQAARLLAQLNTARIAREDRLAFAVQARRAGVFAWGLRLLAPLVHPEKNKWRVTASHAEMAEYAVLLQKSGAAKEALNLLLKVDTKLVPEAALYRAFCYFSTWDYQAALPELENYMHTDLGDYARLVAQLNYASALVVLERGPEALAMLDDISARSAKDGHTRLIANCRELRAQTYIQGGEWASAGRELEAAEAALGTDSTHDQLFVQKWKAILNGLRTGDIGPIEIFREQALARRHWESVREADLYSLKVRFEEGKFRRLIAGTPFPAYRERIMRRLNHPAWPEGYLYGGPGSPCLDLASGQVSDGQPLNAGGKIHRLFTILLRDFYRPLKLAGLFGELFPDEYFNVNTSPDRIHQLLRRARQWSLEAGYGDLIQEDNGDYSFAGGAQLAVFVPVAGLAVDKNSLLLKKLESLSLNTFTATEAREALGISQAAFGRFLVWAVENSHLVKLGRGPRTAYAFPVTEIARAAA